MAAPSTTAPGRTQRRDAALAVASVLVPILAWLASLALSYAVADFTCRAVTSAGNPGPKGVVVPVVTVANAVLLLLTVAAGVVGLWVARRGERPPLGFLGRIGAVTAGAFAFGIVLIAVNPLVLEVCGS